MRKIFFTAVIFLLPMLLQAQENKLYGEQYIKAIADNTRLYVSKRPEVKDRLFRSEAVDKKIEEVKKLLKNNRYLAWMFENSFPNTLETTVHYRKTNGEDDTFVYTGDIPAMWLRDSGAQVFPYVRLASKDPKLKSMLRGVILRQLRQINIDPYANAFNDGPTGEGHHTDKTDMQPEVFERKYEIDSLCYPIRLAYQYWLATGDDSIFGQLWLNAIQKILTTFKEQQRKEGPGNYRFEREHGKPKLLAATDMVRPYDRWDSSPPPFVLQTMPQRCCSSFPPTSWPYHRFVKPQKFSQK